MTQLQKFCAYCGKRTKNTGGWRYAPIFCSVECEKKFDEKHQKRLREDVQYAKEDKRNSVFFALYFVIFGVVPIIVFIGVLLFG